MSAGDSDALNQNCPQPTVVRIDPGKSSYTRVIHQAVASASAIFLVDERLYFCGKLAKTG